MTTNTTERNRATITAIFEAMSRGETRPFGEAMADDFTWHMTGTTAWSGTYTGKADVQQRMLRSLREQWATRYKSTPSRILADGDYVVVETRGDVTTKTGKLYNNTYCFVIRMRDDKMVDLTEYFDTELVTAALEPPAWA
jgi:ketosteroid isomerase-like protein